MKTKIKSYLPFAAGLAATVLFSISQPEPIIYDGDWQMYFIDWGVLISIVSLFAYSMAMLYGAICNEGFSQKKFWFVASPFILILVCLHSFCSTYCFYSKWLEDIKQYGYCIEWGWVVPITILLIMAVVMIIQVMISTVVVKQTK